MTKVRSLVLPALAFVVCVTTQSQTPTPRQLPDGPGKDITQKVCGATCHGPDIIMGTGRTREQWGGVVNSMVARGAKGTDAELSMIATYLSAHFAPGMVTAAPPSRPIGNGPSSPPAQKGPGPLGAGAADSHVVDDKGADRGKTAYIAECITCHGNKARGGNVNLPPNQQGPDLVRSLTVLHDRYGSEIGPYLLKGHPLQSGKPASTLSKAQIGDLAHYLHQRVYYTLRGYPELQLQTQSVLSGDAAAGKAYFEGAGKCSTCHSVTGDMAGIGKRYDPPTMQSKFLFPRTVAFARGAASSNSTKSNAVTVTVTEPNGVSYEGLLDKLDDFNVSMRDERGEYHSFKITPTTTVVKHDPLEEHVRLLDQYTDKNMHDIVAYLESLK